MPEKTHREAVKSVCEHWGASLFGVADLRSLSKEHLLLPPSTVERLPLAISIAYHLSDPILDGIEDRPTPLYFHHYQRTNILLDTIGLMVNTHIQDLGFQALPIAASQLIDWDNQKGHLSHKHVAKAAGLGWIGRNNLLVNERFGARIRLLTLLTNLPMETDAPSSSGCGSCRACLSVCPAGAIKERPEDFDHRRCFEQLKVFSKTLRMSHHICGVCIRACRGRGASF